jgi:hypothetical protein
MSSNKPEKVEEKKFVTKVESHGWDCIKLSTQGAYGRTGRNDRLVLASYGVVAVFEFKRDGEEAEPLQDFYHRRLAQMGHRTYVVHKSDEAYKILLEIVGEAAARANVSKKKKTRQA